jgi:DNA primase
VPILWDELKEDLPSNFYNIRNIFDRFLSNMADPWENYFAHPQAITEQMLHTFD